MKKAFCFSLIVMFLALASSSLLVKADDVTVVTPYVDSATLTSEQINNLRNTSLLLEYLRNGGTIDISNTSSNYSASDLLNDFGNFVEDIVSNGLDIINPFQTEVQYHGLQPIRVAEPAIWNLLGLLPFHALSENENDTPQPTPPVDYAQYIDIINGTGFDFIRSMSITTWNGRFNNVPMSYPSFNGLPASYTWYTFSNNGTDIPWNKNKFSYINSALFCSEHGIDTINITFDDVDNKYKCILQKNNTQSYYDFTFPIMRGNNWDNNSLTSPKGSLYGNFYTYTDYLAYENCNPWYNGGWSTKTLSYDTLDLLFQQLCRYVRNVNIYVDGELWSQVGTPQSYNIQISTGTVLPSNDGEPSDGKVRWEYDTYIYYDIDLIEQELSLLLDEIRNQNHPTIIKFDDLDNLIVDADGQPAIAVKVFTDDRNIDEIYLANYGPLIPAFIPLFTPVIDDVDIYNIASTAVSPIPEDLLEVFGYMFMGVLFIGFIHRLLE